MRWRPLLPAAVCGTDPKTARDAEPAASSSFSPRLGSRISRSPRSVSPVFAGRVCPGVLGITLEPLMISPCQLQAPSVGREREDTLGSLHEPPHESDALPLLGSEQGDVRPRPESDVPRRP